MSDAPGGDCGAGGERADRSSVRSADRAADRAADHRARAALTRLVEPGDAALRKLLRTWTAPEILELITER